MLVRVLQQRSRRRNPAAACRLLSTAPVSNLHRLPAKPAACTSKRPASMSLGRAVATTPMQPRATTVPKQPAVTTVKPRRSPAASCTKAAAVAAGQEQSPAGQRLRQAAAAARNEKLRGAARQLRSVRAPAQASTSTQQAARAQPIAAEAATSLPHSAACSKDEERPGGVHVAQASAVAAVAAWPSDSDPDDVLEELSLAMLTRRRLGLAPSAAALPAAPCCARRALLDASADAELPCLAGSRQQQQLMSAACSPQPPVEPARAAVHTAVRVLPQGREQQETGEQPVTVHAIVDLQAATAAMQVQLEQLRCALRSPALQSVPPRSVGEVTMPPQPLHSMHLGTAPQYSSTYTGPAAALTAAASLPQRRRLANSELVLTRAPSKPATATASALPSVTAAKVESHAGQLPGSCTSSCSQATSQSRTFGPQLVSGQRSGTRCAEPVPQLRWPVQTHADVGVPAGSLAAAAGPVGKPALSAAAGSHDILEAWRRRRRQGQGPMQAERMIDKYSRYLTLQHYRQQQQESCMPESCMPAHGGLIAMPGCADPAAPKSLSQQSLLHERVRAEAAAAASRQPWVAAAAGSGGDDILQRWRARRRRQAACAGGRPDYTPLLVLTQPGSVPCPTSCARLQPAPLASTSSNAAAASEAPPRAVGLQQAVQEVAVCQPMPSPASTDWAEISRGEPAPRCCSAPTSRPCRLSEAASVLEQPAAAAEVVQACSSSSSNDGGSRPSRNEGSSSGSAAAAIQPHQPAQHEEAVAGQEPADNHAAAASCGCDGDGEAVQLASRPQSAESSGCATPARCGVHDR